MKNYIFAFVLLGITLPLLQYIFAFANHVKALHGEVLKPNVDFIALKWDSGEFQEKKEAYLNQNFGFRPFLVRTHNEFEYRFFDKLNVNDVIVGKDQYLFQPAYVAEYTGSNFLGEKALKVKMDKLLALKDSLAKRNILLLLMLTPSKAHFYSEYLPEAFKQKGRNNYYDNITAACKNRNIPCINFNDYVISQKKTVNHLLFTREGIHWSAYCAALCMDSLFKRIEHEKKIDMADFDWHNIEYSTIPRGTDNDLKLVMNLLSEFPTQEYSYPKLEFHAKAGQSKVKLLSIGDSFWGDIYNSGAYQNLFESGEHWVWFANVYANEGLKPLDKNLIRQKIEENDIVIIESTGSNLDHLGWGFIELAYDKYVQQKSPEMLKAEYDEKIESYILTIKKTPAWFGNMVKLAKDEHVTIDSMIHRNAIYMVEKESK